MTGLSRRRLRILVAVAFVVGVVEFMPAHLFEAHLNQALPPPWNLTVTGTIWNGFGVLRAGHSSESLTVPLTWTFDPLALARRRLAWNVVPTSPSLSGTVNIGAGWQSVEFRDAALTLDAGKLQQAFPVLALFAPSGTLVVRTPGDARLTLDYAADFRLNGDAQVKADYFGLGSLGPQALGNYQLNFTGRDTTIDYVITQSSGALTLDGGGSIQMAAPRRIVYSGNVTPSPALADDVLARLKAIGQATADGRLHVDWKGGW